MNITSEHVTGFFVGVGTTAVAYYFYKKNQTTVDDFLRSQGIKLPETNVKEYSAMTLEELVSEKEHLEDLIAEREMSAKQPEKSEK